MKDIIKKIKKDEKRADIKILLKKKKKKGIIRIFMSNIN